MSADRRNAAETLRQKAEAMLGKSPETLQREDLMSINKLAHELAVHQVQLEMQNEELRSTQMALQAARDRFAALFEQAPVGYVIVDSSGIIRQTNATWRAMLGRPDEDLRGTPFSNTLADEDVPTFLSRFRVFFRNPAQKRIIARMKRRGAPAFYAQIEAKAHDTASESDRGASPSQLMVIVNDISDLLQARREIEIRNKELGRANERLEHINRVLLGIQNTNQIIVTENDPRRLIEQACLNLTETMGYLNVWIALLGGEAGQALGLPGEDAVAAVASAGFDGGFEVLRERLERGELPSCMACVLNAENAFISANPTSDCPDCPLSRDYSGRTALVRRLHFGGVTYGVFTTSVPAHCAREAEEQKLFNEVADDLAFALHKIATARRLHESQRRYREIFEHSRDGFVMVDTAGRILDANNAYCEMLGYTLDELRLLPNFYAITPERWHDWESREIWENRLMGRRYSGIYEKEYVRKDGTVFPVELNAYTVCNEYGDIDYLWATVRDTTERKHMEEQLIQLQKMESVGKLAGGVAHDFNNMLSVILGHTEIALGELAADSPLRADLEEIHKAAERSANLTRQLLAFARKQTIAPKVLDLNETIASTLKMLQRLIGEDIDMLWRPAPELARTLIDPGQVNQILANLAVNARDAIGHHHGRVTIETANVCIDEAYCVKHVDVVPGDFVMLAVSDDGCGMDEETRLQIFEPFFTTKPLGEGTGLGLSTVYGIVKQNNGFINVYSEPGKGTTLRIYFPALRDESGQNNTIKQAGAAPVGGKEVILVVEDEASLLNLTRTMLEHLGYTVLPAASPDDAIRIAREYPGTIDLLITDVVMPEMNGLDLARKMQASFPGIRRLFMSGYMANIVAHQGGLNEGDNFLQKPFSLSDLAKKVREVLEN